MSLVKVFGTYIKAVASIILYDEFTGSGNIVGRSPDTVDNGKVWRDVGFSTGNVIAGGGYARQELFGGGRDNVTMIDTENIDFKITSFVFHDVVSPADSWIFARNQVGASGFPTDVVYTRVEHDNNRASIVEIVGGVSSFQFQALNPPENQDYEITLTVQGSLAQSMVNDVDLTDFNLAGSYTSVNSEAGFYTRADTSVDNSKVASFKVEAV